MNLLTRLTPAEVLFLRKYTSSSLKDLIKYTSLHLMVRGALHMKTETRLDRRGNARKYHYVIPGPMFDTYPAKPHEQELLYILKDERYARGILLRFFIRLLFKKVDTGRAYMRYVIRSADMRHYARRTLGLYFYTRQGREQQRELINEFKQAENDFSAALKNDRTRAAEMLSAFGGNAWLLHDVPSDLLERLNKGLTDEEAYQATLADNDWYDDYLFNDFFDSYDHSFDSAGSDWGDGGSDGDGDGGDW